MLIFFLQKSDFRFRKNKVIYDIEKNTFVFEGYNLKFVLHFGNFNKRKKVYTELKPSVFSLRISATIAGEINKETTQIKI